MKVLLRRDIGFETRMKRRESEKKQVQRAEGRVSLEEWKDSQCGKSKLCENKHGTIVGLKASLTAHVECQTIRYRKNYNFIVRMRIY